MNNDDDDFVREHEGFVVAIVLGTVVALILCVLLIYFGGQPQ